MEEHDEAGEVPAFDPVPPIVTMLYNDIAERRLVEYRTGAERTVVAIYEKYLRLAYRAGREDERDGIEIGG